MLFPQFIFVLSKRNSKVYQNSSGTEIKQVLAVFAITCINTTVQRSISRVYLPVSQSTSYRFGIKLGSNISSNVNFSTVYETESVGYKVLDKKINTKCYMLEI